jgi:hypothetical protein
MEFLVFQRLQYAKGYTVFSLIVAHAPLFFEAKILEIFTLVPLFDPFKGVRHN